MNAVTVSPAARAVVSEHAWGRLTWFASQALGNSAAMTIGRCEIRPGHENPRHFHPNCEEILVVLSGTILHTAVGQPDVRMTAGDCITLPPGVAHNARNVGPETAVLSIAFSAADRQTVAAEPGSQATCR